MKNKNNVTSSAKKVKAKRIRNYAFLFFGLFGVTAATAYFLIPSKKNALGTGGSDDPTSESDIDTMTPAQHFTSQLMSMTGLKATVDSFSASIPNSKDSANPEVISLKDTTIQLVVNGWPDVSFDLDTTITLNNQVSKDINISYAGSNLYFSALGLKYKTTSETIDNLFDDIYSLSEAAGIDNVDLGTIDTSKASGLLNNLTSVSDDAGYTYTLPLDDAKTQIITMKSDKSYNLTNVSATNLVFNGVTLNFAITTDTTKVINTATFVPEHPENYLDIYNSWTMIRKVADLVMKPSFGVSASIDMTKSVTEGSTTKTYEVANIAASANLNVQSSLYNGSVSIKAPIDSTLKSDFAGLSADKITAQSVEAAYVPTTANDGKKDGKVYATYNDALNLKMTTSVANALITKIKANMPTKDSASTSKLFSFITDSTVMKALSKGQYEAVVNMLSDFQSKDNQIVATISLKDLGLGDNAKIVVTLDGNTTASSLASIDVSAVEMSNYEMNANFALTSYVDKTVVDTNYDSLDALPNVYDQFYALSQNIQSGATIDGSVMGYDSKTKGATKNGMSFSGSTEFDANQDTTKDAQAKSGTGLIDITQIKDGANYQTHEVSIDVRGTDKMLFRYTSSASAKKDYLNGKFTIDTLNDIIALVTKLTKSTDARYTKFMDALTETTATTVVGQIMAKNYETLLQNKVLTKLRVFSDSIDLTLDKKLLGSTSDINVSIALDANSKVSGLHLTNFAISGKLINFNMGLTAYDSGKISQLPDNITYLDFSQIAVLMQFGITTSALSYFHVTATANVEILGINAVKPNLDFYISVDGATVKVVGTISNIPLIWTVNGSHAANPLAINGKRTVTFYYQTGYCYLHGYDDYQGNSYDGSTGDVKVKDTYFVQNMLHYLLAEILELTTSKQKMIGSSSASTSTDPVKYEDVLKSYQYSNASGTTPIWKLVLNTGVLANDSALGDLTITFSGTDSDSSDGVLDGLLDYMDVNLEITELVSIKISLTAHLADHNDYTNFFATTWANYIAAHASDTVEGA